MTCTRCHESKPLHLGLCHECETARYGSSAFDLTPAQYDAHQRIAETRDWMRVQADQEKWGTTGNVSY